MGSSLMDTDSTQNGLSKWRAITGKRFSRAHPDYQTMLPATGCHGRGHYEAYRNSSQQTRDEIFDIYFGKIFRTEVNGRRVTWGNVMGVEASDEAVDWLFRLQDDLGIEISLTMNQLNVPWELYDLDGRVQGEFLGWLKTFYDRGLRSCTIGNAHLMNTGVLQQTFPEMRWKNTVNQMVCNAQMVADCLELGYTFVQLDRSLIRNMDELRNVKRVVDLYRKRHPEKEIVTCLLVEELCLPFCPFKREHDDIQIRFHPEFGGHVYWQEMGQSTCGRWRAHPEYGGLPRAGTNCFWSKRETFEEYAGLVDVFKSSGRLGVTHPPDSVIDQGSVLAIVRGVNPEFLRVAKASMAEKDRMRAAGAGLGTTTVFVDSYADILEQNLHPINAWMTLWCDLNRFKPPMNVDTFRDCMRGHFYTTDEYYELEERLKNCRNQCWDCHLCEQVYGVPKINSLVSLAGGH